jgi:hypothetical protein
VRLATVAVIVGACAFRHGVEPARDDAPMPDTARQPDSPSTSDAGPPSVEFVQGSAGTDSWNTSASTITGSLLGVTTGDLVVVYVTYATGGNPQGLSDGTSNSYSQITSINGPNSQSAALYYAEVVTGGDLTITASLAIGRCCRAMIVHELRGANAGSPVVGAATNQQSNPPTTANAVMSAALTTPGAGDYVLAITTDVNNIPNMVISAGTGEAARENPNTGGNRMLSEDRHGPGMAPSTFTFSQTNGTAMTIVSAFKP